MVDLDDDSWADLKSPLRAFSSSNCTPSGSSGRTLLPLVAAGSTCHSGKEKHGNAVESRKDSRRHADRPGGSAWVEREQRTRNPSRVQPTQTPTPLRLPLVESVFLPEDSWADRLPTRVCAIAPHLVTVVRNGHVPGSDFGQDFGFTLDDDSWADLARATRQCPEYLPPEGQLSDSSPVLATPLRFVAEVPGAEPTCSHIEATPASKEPLVLSRFSPPDLPLQYATFKGQVIEVHADDDSAGAQYSDIFSRSRFERCFPELVGLPLLVGLDFEWKPDRKRSDDNPIALVQIACWDTAFIVRTTGCEVLPQWLAEFLEDEQIIKVVASFDLADKLKLKTSFDWDFDSRVKQPMKSYIDIAILADERSVPRGMMKMSRFFGNPMLKSKSIGSSNWAREEGLSSDQLVYAADDAFFQLYLLGKLLRYSPLPADNSLLQSVLKSWTTTAAVMEESIKLVDNSVYRRCFFELRDVTIKAVDVLCRALGSGGTCALNNILSYPPVQKALAHAQKKCTIGVNLNFIRENKDAFHSFFENGELRVRPRLEDDEVDCEGKDSDDHQVSNAVFLDEVLELLSKYEPPLDKKPTVLCRNVPEQFWVPARALLTRQQQARFENCMQESDSIETSHSDMDGLLLRMSRHPRAADDAEIFEVCVELLRSYVSITAEESRSRINSDKKFMEFWATLRTLEAKSKEEAQVHRGLRARVKILADSHRVGQRLNPLVPWEQVRDGLEQVKWYRRLLGGWMNGCGEREDRDLQDCLDAIVAAWPDVKSVLPPSKAKRGAGDAGRGRDPKRQKCGRKGQQDKGRGKGA